MPTQDDASFHASFHFPEARGEDAAPHTFWMQASRTRVAVVVHQTDCGRTYGGFSCSGRNSNVNGKKREFDML